jgi:dihydropteroate synthase
VNINELNSIFFKKSEVPAIMGIINLDENSFYKESIAHSIDQCLFKIENMLHQGMDILDLGAFSSRPGAEVPEYNEERALLFPFIKAIVKHYPELIISLDTMRAEIAKEAIEYGVEIINDISAASFDPSLPEVVANSNKILIAMHMRGQPTTMMNPENVHYTNIITELIEYFSVKLNTFKDLGLNKIIVDPGFGFSKKTDSNYEILNKLEILQILNKPILIGISRKSMIWKTLNATPQTSLIGTLIAEYHAILQGCQLLRVHDIKETKEMLTIYKCINSTQVYN